MRWHARLSSLILCMKTALFEDAIPSFCIGFLESPSKGIFYNVNCAIFCPLFIHFFVFSGLETPSCTLRPFWDILPLGFARMLYCHLWKYNYPHTTLSWVWRRRDTRSGPARYCWPRGLANTLIWRFNWCLARRQLWLVRALIVWRSAPFILPTGTFLCRWRVIYWIFSNGSGGIQPCN